MLKYFARYLKGFIRIRIKCSNYEKVLNKFALNSLSLWNLKIAENFIEVNINLKDYLNIRRLMKNRSFKIKILRRVGLPFFFRKYKKRKVFVIGMITTYIILTILSSMIWEINIYGTDKINKYDILLQLEKNNVMIGKFSNSIDYEKVQNDIYKNFSDIIWLNMYKKGTSINLEIVESVNKSVEVEEEIPSNIVADKRAVITNIVTLKGIPKVKAKDVVNVGDLLVSGELEVEINGVKSKKYVNATANIEGKNYLYICVDQELETVTKEYTGKKYRDVKINVGGFEIKIPNTFKKFTAYDTKGRMVKILPTMSEKELCFVINEYEEYRVRVDKHTPEEIKNKIEEKVYKYLLNNLSIDTKILDVRIDYSFNENKAFGNAVVVVLEKIGQKKIIENY